jgi:hypothetical protein
MSLREDMVENGIAFWKHDRVKDTPFNERVSFLRQKGLTQEEIDEVKRRSIESEKPGVDPGVYRQPPPTQNYNGNNGGGGYNPNQNNNNYNNSIPPQMSYPPIQYVAPPPRSVGFFERIYNILAPIVTVGALGAGGMYLYQRLYGAPAYMYQNNGGLFSPFPANNPMGTHPGTPLTPHGSVAPNTPGAQTPNGQIAPGNALKNGSLNTPNTNDTNTNNNRNNNSSLLRDTPWTTSKSSAPEITSLRAEMKSMTENFESQSKQLRDAIATLNEIVQTQTAQSANNTSMGLLLANHAANQSAQERDIKKELSQIKVILATGLTPNATSGNGDGKSTPANGGGANAFADILKAAEEEDTKKREKEEKERKEKELDEKKEEDMTEEEKELKQKRDKEKRDKKIAEEVAKMKENINVALDNMLKENENATKKTAHGMLSMILKNLKEQPDVPRYRRVKKDNPNFKKMVVPLKGHEEFLVAMGFTSRGNYFEFGLIPKSHEKNEEEMEDAKTLAKQILEYSVECVGKLKEEQKPVQQTEQLNAQQQVAATATVPPPVTNVAGVLPQQQQLPAGQTLANVQQAKEYVEPPLPSVITPQTTINAATTVGSTQQQPAAQTSSGWPPNGNVIPNLQPPANVWDPNSSTSTQQLLQQQQEASATRPNGIAPNKTSATTSGDQNNNGNPSYPLSFGEIMKMTQEGKTPPGIKQIPNILSADQASLSTGDAPTKPWEQK